MGRIDSSQIRKAFDLAARLKDPINLSIGQPHYQTPPVIVDAIAQAMKEGKTSYTPTQGILPLREKLAETVTRQGGENGTPETILISSGVSSLLQLLFMTCIDPGDKIVLVDPYFLIYKSLGDFFNAEIVTIPENFTEEDLSALRSEPIRMILFCTPSNPTGTILSQTQIRQLADLAEQTGALLVSDEIYELFDYDDRFVSTGTIYDKALVLKGFSKTYSMTGLRLAYAAGPAQIIKAMTILQQYTVVCAPAPVQWGALTALETDMSQYIVAYKQNRDYCMKRLTGKTKFPTPSGAFYLFPEVPQEDAAFTNRAVEEKKLILVPGNIFSSSRNHVRLSFAVSPETLERGIDAFLSLL